MVIEQRILMMAVAVLRLAGGQQDCKEGEVRDLDGSCVKKVTFPPRERKNCPDISIAGGDYFLRMGGRMAEFYCDTDHIRVPDTEVAICQVTGSWSKQIPVCLKPGCQVPESPAHGFMAVEYEATLLQFHCLPSHQLIGPPLLACPDGRSWNGTVPHCKKRPEPLPERRPTGAAQRLSSSLLFPLLLVIPTCVQSR